MIYLLRSDDDRPDPTPKSIRVPGLIAAVILTAMILIRVAEAPDWESRAVYFPLLVIPALFVYFVVTGQWMVRNVRWIIPVLIGAAVSSFLMLAWVRPHPLPAIHIEMKRTTADSSARPVEVNGMYVGYDGNVWFVQTDTILRGIPAENVALVLLK